MAYDNVKQVVHLGCTLGEAVAGSLADGKWSFSDIHFFLPVVTSVAAALGDIQKVPEELKAMSPEDFDELRAYVKTELELPDEQVEAAIELGCDVGVKLLQLALSMGGK